MTLIDLIDLLFSNLNELEDLTFIDEVLENIKYSSVSYLEPIFVEIKNFYKSNNRYPDFSYIKILGGDLIRENNNLEFSSDVFIRILNYIKEEAKMSKAIEALSKRDTSKALFILQSQSTSIVKEITGIENSYNEYKDMKSRPPGLKTGIPEVDSIFRSISRSSVTCFVAPPKNGKTTTAISVFYHNIMNYDLNVVYIILEGTAAEIKFNLISLHSKKIGKPISAFKIKTLELTEEEEVTLQEVIADFEATRKGKYAILEPQHFYSITPMEVTRTLKLLKANWGGKLDGVISDYVQLYKYYRVPGINEEKAVINFWIRYWHDICIAEDFAKILLAQMNRDGELMMRTKNMVSAKALAEANELERSSARVLAIRSDTMMQQSNLMKLYFVYHRYGPIPADPVDTYADFAHYQIGENSFSSIRTLSNVENLLDANESIFS